MSTDHYVTCRKHMQCIHVAQDGLRGYAFYSGEPDCMKKLGDFLKEHNLCTDSLRFEMEQYVIDDDFHEIEWTPKHRLPGAVTRATSP